MRSNTYLKLREMAVFAMLGTVMFCSKIIMEALPNIHLLGMLTMTYTVAFRKKALIPIYIYIMLNGLYAGFSLWWMPYLFIIKKRRVFGAEFLHIAMTIYN
jgi:energy-coupling factor transport system substrate-specific component